MHTKTAASLNSTLADSFASTLGQFVSPDQPFALLDFPDHPNIGDSAIYAGEIAFFDRHVRRPASYVCSINTYRRDIDDFCPEGPLFLHGGGNFGSIWQKHQRFRHDVIGRYKNRRIVQMAQSVHFASGTDSLRDESKRLIGEHPDFIMLVRDKPSYDFVAAEFDCPVLMCPDAAHCLQYLPTTRQPQHDVLSVLRDDKETAGGPYADFLRQTGPIVDWGRQPLARSVTDRAVEALVQPRFPGSSTLMRRRERMYRRQADYRIRYGTRLLSKGKLIVSDRLHAHLLASLMQKPHICLDNIYGKISRYISAWGTDDKTIQVHNLAELKDAMKAMVSSGTPV